MRIVRHTDELDRVRALPRRRLDKGDAAELAAELTLRLRVPGATCELRPWQGLCLFEALEAGGLFAGLPVGQGKTLIAEMLPVVLRSARAALVLPAALRAKTFADRRALVRDGWRLASPPPRIFTLEGLTSERIAHDFTTYAPDLIIIDEADTLANIEASAAKRIDRYVVAARPRVACMTGTPSRKSIMAYWHLLCWTLGDGAPVPLREGEAKQWAGALDDTGPRGDKTPRVRPGPLGATRREARAWFRDRLSQTPGVVLVDEDSCDAPLEIRERLAREDDAIDRWYEQFLLTQENPAGIPVSDPLSRWRLDTQLGSGLYLRWNPDPPPEWREARKTIARFVRDTITLTAASARPCDTESQVLRRYPDEPAVRTWLEVRDMFDPTRHTEAVWLSYSAVESAIDWLDESPEPGIIWCGIVEFAEALARASGLPYYAARGRDARTRRELHDADPRRSMVCSWNANKRGFNLQAWTRQLVCQPPPSAKYLEQIIGRSHRAGQRERVTIDVLATSGGTLDGFDAALSEAGFSRDTSTLTQKILRADITRAEPRISASNRFRWARKP